MTSYIGLLPTKQEAEKQALRIKNKYDSIEIKNKNYGKQDTWIVLAEKN